MAKFNEVKYNKAIEELAKQVVLMVKEDVDVEDQFDTLEDYLVDTYQDLVSAAKDMLR